MPLVNGPLDWSRIHLIVFDVDGTLYDQRLMRISMLASLLVHVVTSSSVDVLRILRVFRQLREELAESMAPNFVNRQYELVAEQCGCDASKVQRVVDEWMERRPLRMLFRCRLPGLPEVFRAASEQRKTIGVFSDYPARDKMEALRLDADIVVSAGDPEIGFLKPHPLGLHRLLQLGNVPAESAIMIGDRVERDWAVANKLGVRALIRTKKNIPGVDTFTSYKDSIFQDLLRGAGK